MTEREYLINDSVALAKEILAMLKEDLEICEYDLPSPESYIHGVMLMKRDRLLSERVVKI